jgi:Flp pilus assembly protein TadB
MGYQMISPRLLVYAAIAVALAAGGWKCYTAGQKNIRAAWTAEKLAASETARLREQAAQKSNERVDREYQTQKARLAADKRATDDRLRDFQAVASSDTTAITTSGTDDPYRAIADQCVSALVVLDGYAQSVAGKATALQNYTREVCVIK